MSDHDSLWHLIGLAVGGAGSIIGLLIANWIEDRRLEKMYRDLREGKR